MSLKALVSKIACLTLGSGALRGNRWFVDSVNGSDTDSGKSWGSAKATIAAAVAAASAFDEILIRGSFSEAVTVTLEGLKLIGVGPTVHGCRWTAATDLVCLTINANNVEVRNIRFSPPAYTASRVTSAITLSSANYAKIVGCRFQGKTGSQIAIYSPVCNSDNVEISDCDFQYMNTATYGAGILGVEAGGLSYSCWKILRNTFQSCVTAININGRCCRVEGNVIQEYGIAAAGTVGAVLALGIDLSGTSSGANAVVRNLLGGTYGATLYKVGASGDLWYGNDIVTTGHSAANPA
jgi:hypothetical protein